MTTKVLIVDDEPYTIDMLSTFLQINGYETVGAPCGEDGLVLAQVERPQLMILDLMLPDIEGYEVCRRLRATHDFSGLPVLVLSARIETSARERAINAGADGFLTKPVQFRELLSEMTRLLTSPRELPQVAAIPEPPTVAPPAAPTAAPITESPAAPPAEATNNTPVDPASKPQLPTSDAPQATMPSDPADPGVKPQ